MKQEAKTLNDLSEMLFGYREAPDDHIKERVRQLIQSDRELRLYKHAPKLAVAVRNAVAEIMKAAEEIESAELELEP